MYLNELEQHIQLFMLNLSVKVQISRQISTICFPLFLNQTIYLGDTQKDRLDEKLFLSTVNVCFGWVIAS